MGLTFAVDWDGTCVRNAWPEQPREWLPGAVDALKRLSALGDVVIHSCRVAPFEFGDWDTARDLEETASEINYIESMLAEAGIRASVWTRTFKPPAVVYIDDKAVQLVVAPDGQTNWGDIAGGIERVLAEELRTAMRAAE